MAEIHSLVEEGYYDEVAELLSAHPEAIAMKNEIGNEPLHVACRAKQVAIAGLLLYRGANVNAVGSNGMTPLHYAVFEGGTVSIPIVQILLDHGADSSIRDAGGFSPADLAKIDMTTGLGQVLRLLEDRDGDRGSGGGRDDRKSR